MVLICDAACVAHSI